MINAPCKDCQERHINCHSSCQKYADFKKEQAITNSAKHQDTMLRAHDIYRAERFKKRSKK